MTAPSLDVVDPRRRQRVAIVLANPARSTATGWPDRPRHPAHRARDRAVHDRRVPIADRQFHEHLCDDVRSTCRQLKALGVEFAQEPQAAEWGTLCILKDADGNQFVLSSR